MFIADDVKKNAEKNRKSILSDSSKESERFAIQSLEVFCRNQYSEELDEIIPKLKEDSELVYGFIGEYQQHELNRSSVKTKKVRISKGKYKQVPFTPKEKNRIRDVSERTIKMRMTYIKALLKKNGIEVTEQRLKETLGKVMKRLRKPITADDVAKVVMHSEKRIKAMVMMQATSGMRMTEVRQLRMKDLERKARWQIRIPAEIAKTREERITYMTEEASEYVEPFLKDKEPDDLVFASLKDNTKPISKSGYTKHVYNAVKRAGLDEKYEHSGQLRVTSHGFRSFFITELGKAEGFFGHYLAGHSWANKEYDRYDDKAILRVFMDYENRLKIFDRGNPDYENVIKQMKQKILQMEERIETLKEEGNLTVVNAEDLPELKVN